MRTVKNTSITLPAAMLKEAERVAREEGRTKSELFREAFRRYVREREWDQINAYGRARAKALGIKPQNVNRIIHEYRQEQRKRTKKTK
jgi:CopG family transcriptional regulator/antitoxin EndoAI